VQLGSQGQNPYPYRSADEWQSAINRAERSRDFDEAERLTSAWEAYEGVGSQTKYGKYTLPGGENYREMLLTLPNTKANALQARADEIMEMGRAGTATDADRTEWASIMNRLQPETRDIEGVSKYRGFPEYKSSHFDEPNILAHIRVNDRVDADGKKMLLIEEIQSDWHQAGREKGYASKETKRIKGTVEEQPSDYGFQTDYKVVWEDGTFSGGYGTKEIAQEVALKGKSNAKEGVPDAPFKDTWYQLALKRVLKHAADNGYERVGLTTGKQQIDRFSDQFRQNVDEIEFSSGYPNKDTFVVNANKDGNPIFQGTVVEGKFTEGAAQGKTLDEVFGKSIAKKIVSHDPSQGLGTIKGDNLSIGGEGMKKYYDEVYPQFLDKYGKKWNAKVGETQITTDYARDANGIPAQRPSKESIRYIDITPEMKGAVSKGQPLFAAAPVGSIGLGYQKDKADNLEETSPMYTDPFGNTIGSSIR
jgi:hypothetical protein